MIELNNELDISEYCKKISSEPSDFLEFLNETGISKMVQITEKKVILSKSFKETEGVLYLGRSNATKSKSEGTKQIVAEVLEREKKMM